MLKDGNSFIATDEELVIESIKQEMRGIFLKSSLSDFSSDLEKLLRLQSALTSLQAIVNHKRGISFKNAFGGESYSEEHLQMMNSIYDEYMPASITNKGIRR